LNTVYFGDGYYGIEAAARGYFGKAANQLTVVEAATLAGLIQSPSTYAPREAPDRARARRNRVLRAMRDAGRLTPADSRRFENAPLTVQPRSHDEWARRDDATGDDRFRGLSARDECLASHRDGRCIARRMQPDVHHRLIYVKEELRRLLLKRFGPEQLYQGGLRVFATIDPHLPLAAEDAVAARIRDPESAKALQPRDHRETLDGSVLTSTYSAAANEGLRAAPVQIRRVEDRTGHILWQTPAATRRAVTAEPALLMFSMLSDVIQTGSKVRTWLHAALRRFRSELDPP
jgi:membrane peptidoglycan carboxypeptidase